MLEVHKINISCEGDREGEGEHLRFRDEYLTMHNAGGFKIGSNPLISLLEDQHDRR
jgi:hypothetical protein